MEEAAKADRLDLVCACKARGLRHSQISENISVLLFVLPFVYSYRMPPKVTTEVEGDEPTVTGTTSTTTTGASGPGTLRQRFKLNVEDISKEVEELSVKLKRKVGAHKGFRT
jgi:hypothetical protein